jgi:hypothetical protein
MCCVFKLHDIFLQLFYLFRFSSLSVLICSFVEISQSTTTFSYYQNEVISSITYCNTYKMSSFIQKIFTSKEASEVQVTFKSSLLLFFVTGLETLQILGVEMSTGGSTESNEGHLSIKRASKKTKQGNYYYPIFNRCYCGVTRVAHLQG